MFNIFSKAKETIKNYTYAKMLDGRLPVFSQFGTNIYANDVVQSCCRCIATEISKLQPTHIRSDPNGSQVNVKGSINRLLKYSPNPLMTTKDFLEKCSYLWLYHCNCFIYPTYDVKKIGQDKYIREYTGFYPLNPTNVEFIQDSSNTLFIRFKFGNGHYYTLPYSDIIHWRRDFSLNDLMGGDENGQANHQSILKVLNFDNILFQGIEKGIKASLGVRGIIKINSLLNDEKQEEERKAFEEKLKNNESGFLPMDVKGEYIPINVNPKMIDKSTLEFVQGKILNYFGVSLPILTGDFTEEQYQAFYEKTLEPNILALSQAFTKTLFTEKEIDLGNEVNFYAQNLIFTNTKNKIEAITILSNLGTLTKNQALSIFGFPPFPGGDVRVQSLNYVNVDIIDKYQMQKAANGKGVKNYE